MGIIASHSVDVNEGESERFSFCLPTEHLVKQRQIQ